MRGGRCVRPGRFADFGSTVVSADVSSFRALFPSGFDALSLFSCNRQRVHAGAEPQEGPAGSSAGSASRSSLGARPRDRNLPRALRLGGGVPCVRLRTSFEAHGAQPREPDRTAIRAVSRRFVLFHSFRQPGGLDAGVAKALSEHADRALFGGEIGREFGGRGPYGFKKRVAGRHVGRATGFDPFQFLGGNVRGEIRLAEKRAFEECFEAFEFVEELDLGRGRRGVDRAGKERDGSRNPYVNKSNFSSERARVVLI